MFGALFLIFLFQVNSSDVVNRYILFDISDGVFFEDYIYHWIEMSLLADHLNKFYNDCILDTCFKNI
jgi:hypothetical protein